MKTTKGIKKKITQPLPEIVERKKLEEIIESKNLLKKAYDIIQDQLIIIDLDYKIVFANKKVDDLSKIKGKHCYEVTHKSKVPCWKRGESCPLREILQIGKSYTTEHIHYDRKGKKIYCEINAFPIKNKTGEITHIVERIRDITERKKREEEIKKRAKEWRKTIDAISDFVFILDKNFRFVKVNKTICDFLKKEPKDLIGKRCYEVIHGTDRPWSNCPYKKTLETKKPTTEEINDPNLGIPLLITASPIFDDKGKLTSCVHIAKDITRRKKAEEGLRESEEKYRTIFENANDMIIFIDKYGRTTSANKKFTDTLGFKRDEIIGKHFAKLGLLKLKDIPRITKLFVNFLKTGKVLDKLELELQDKEGNTIFAEASNRVIKQNSKREGILCVIRDITERKKAEEKLEAERKKLETYIESMVDGVVITNLKGVIVQANKSYAEMLDYKSPKEMIGKSAFGIIAKKDRPRIMKMFMEAMKKKMCVFKEVELTYLKKDGKKVPIMISVRNVWDKKGKLVYAISVVRDITERKRAETALLEQKNKLQKYFDVAGIMILILSPEGKVLLMNKRGYEILGCEAEDIIGKDWFTNFIPEKNRDEVKAVLAKLMSEKIDGSKYKYFENPVLTKSGKEKIIAWRSTLLGDEQGGRTQAILKVGGDITEFKQAKVTIEQLKELDRLKDEFLNIAAHELKTPLTSIIGLSEIVKEQKPPLDSQYQKYMGIIYDEGNRLSNIVKRMLTVTRFESGRGTVRFEPFNLKTFIPSLLPNLNILAKKNKSRIITNIEKKNIVIRSDKERISQVIYNLVDNAMKYGPEGQSVVISVTKPEKDRVKITVADQGPGISPKLQERLFTKFSQLEPSLSRSQEGTGLGLYICKLIVGRLGGQIGVKSVLGKSSTFYFTLPIKKPSESSPSRKNKANSFLKKK